MALKQYSFRPLHLEVAEEIRDAVASGQPVVALESTIISHGGLPFPQNLELGTDLEGIIRRYKGVPATCAVINGIAKVGLTDADFLAIAHEKSDVIKASRRDLAYAVATRRTASTTVAGTMVLAHAAGIPVFATGGLGGVHRGAEFSFDVSADLTELGKTPITVVCAGVKSILDIPKTLEVLETQGVPVVSLRSDTFPAFFTEGTLPSPRRVESEAEVARMMFASAHSFGNNNPQTGTLVAVPNPEPYSNALELEACIEEALAQAERDGLYGAATTPFLLQSIEKLTAGLSLESNVALVKNNAAVATKIASEYERLKAEVPGGGSAFRATRPAYASPVTVIGGAASDTISTLTSPTAMNSSNLGLTRSSFGGVARNIAEKLGRLCSEEDDAAKYRGVTTSFVSVVGADSNGTALLRALEEIGVDTSNVKVLSAAVNEDTKRSVPSTASYSAIHGRDGDLIVACADFNILDHFTVEDVESICSRNEGMLEGVVVLDGNFSASVFAKIAQLVSSRRLEGSQKGGAGLPLLFFEPTSEHKCLLPLLADEGRKGGLLHCVDVVKPNLGELIAMLDHVHGEGYNAALDSAKELMRKGETISIDTVAELSISLLHLMCNRDSVRQESRSKHVLVSLGEEGVLSAAYHGGKVSTSHHHLGELLVTPQAMHENGLNTNGSGDAFCAGVVLELAREGGSLGQRALKKGMEAAHRQIMNKWK